MINFNCKQPIKLMVVIMLLVLPLLMGCKKEDDLPPDTTPPVSENTFTTIFYNNPTNNADANAIFAHIERNEDHSTLNFYGTFNPDGTPNKLSTVTFQKANNDTIVHYLLNDTTGKLQTSYITIAGVKNPIVFKYDYITGSDNKLNFSVHQYDWTAQTDVLIYQTLLENNNGVLSTNPTYMAFRTSDLINLPGAVATGFAVAEIVFAVGGSAGLITSATTAAMTAAIAAPFVATTVGIFVLTMAMDASASEQFTPSNDLPPQNIPVTNPTINDDPTDNLQENTCNSFSISYAVTMDQQGSIAFSNVTGGVPPYQYSLGSPVNYQSNNLFIGNYLEDNYLVVVKDANNCVNASVRHIAPGVNSCETLTASFTRNGKTVTAAATGGTAPYQFAFQNNGSEQGFSSNNTYDLVYNGNFSVIVKDANGCLDTINSCLNDIANLSLNMLPLDNVSGNPTNGWLYLSYTSSLGLIPEFLIYSASTNDFYLPLLITNTNLSYIPNITDYCNGGGSGGVSLIDYTVTGDVYNRTIKFLLQNTTQPLGNASIQIRLKDNCGGINICPGGGEFNDFWSPEYTLTW